jgi:hypothetical protein
MGQGLYVIQLNVSFRVLNNCKLNEKYPGSFNIHFNSYTYLVTSFTKATGYAIF